MKKTDKQILRELSLPELSKKLVEVQLNLAKHRLALAVGKLKNTHLTLVTDKIAVIKTIMKEKETN